MIEYQPLAKKFYDENTVAIALMGSHARGEAQQYSDVDLVCIHRGDSTDKLETHYFDDQLVVVSQVTVEETSAWFTEPKQIVQVMKNLQHAQPLIDMDSVFAELQQRAHLFEWTADHQRKADRYAAQEMVGLIEEVHKGLNGLMQDHAGRLINASHGLAWGLTYLMLIHRGILTSGDNGLIDDLQSALGTNSEWSRLHRLSFGIPSVASLREQTQASLQLYKLTYSHVVPVCKPEQQRLIEHAIAYIDSLK